MGKGQAVQKVKTEVQEVKKLNKSDVMRKAYDEGKSVAECAKIAGVRYQFAHGVLTRHTKGDLRKASRDDNKSAHMRDLWDTTTKTIAQISKEADATYQFAFSVIKRHVASGNAKRSMPPKEEASA